MPADQALRKIAAIAVDRTAEELPPPKASKRAGRQRPIYRRKIFTHPRGRRWIGLLFATLLCSGCQPVRHPPPTVFFHGLPVSGKLADAQRTGFDDCFNMDAAHLRCRRHAVRIANSGPYEAAVDLEGGNGEGGFDQLIIWHDRDNYEVYKIGEALERAGWKTCSTGEDNRGDQAIYVLKGSPVWVSEDISYYAKRRVRLIPEWNHGERGCTPK